MPAVRMCEQAVVVATCGLLRDAGSASVAVRLLSCRVGLGTARPVGEDSREDEERCSHDAVTSRKSKGISPHLCSSEWPFFQGGASGQPLRYPLVGVVTSASGLPVAGASVTFAVTAGGGALTGIQSVTDAQGVTAAYLTLGPTAEPNTVNATAAGLSGSPLIFTVTPQR